MSVIRYLVNPTVVFNRYNNDISDCARFIVYIQLMQDKLRTPSPSAAAHLFDQTLTDSRLLFWLINLLSRETQSALDGHSHHAPRFHSRRHGISEHAGLCEPFTNSQIIKYRSDIPVEGRLFMLECHVYKRKDEIQYTRHIADQPVHDSGFFTVHWSASLLCFIFCRVNPMPFVFVVLVRRLRLLWSLVDAVVSRFIVHYISGIPFVHLEHAAVYTLSYLWPALLMNVDYRLTVCRHALWLIRVWRGYLPLCIGSFLFVFHPLWCLLILSVLAVMALDVFVSVFCANLSFKSLTRAVVASGARVCA